MSTYLQLVQLFCAKVGQPTPSALVASTDATFKQLHALAIEAVQDMSGDPFPRVKKRVTWTSAAGEDQGLLSTRLGSSIAAIDGDTLWDNTARIPIQGPVTQEMWQVYKNTGAAGPTAFYIILEGKLLVAPAMAAGHTCSAIITVPALVQDSSGNAKEIPTADDDSFRFSDILFKMELEWRWRKAHGEPYEDLQAEALSQRAIDIARSSPQPVLNLTPAVGRVLKPGIWVPAGSWNVS